MQISRHSLEHRSEGKLVALPLSQEELEAIVTRQREREERGRLARAVYDDDDDDDDGYYY